MDLADRQLKMKRNDCIIKAFKIALVVVNLVIPFLVFGLDDADDSNYIQAFQQYAIT